MPAPAPEQPPSSPAPPRSTRQALTVELLYLDEADSLWDTKRDDLRGLSWHQAAPASPVEVMGVLSLQLLGRDYPSNQPLVNAPGGFS